MCFIFAKSAPKHCHFKPKLKLETQTYSLNGKLNSKIKNINHEDGRPHTSVTQTPQTQAAAVKAAATPIVSCSSLSLFSDLALVHNIKCQCIHVQYLNLCLP